MNALPGVTRPTAFEPEWRWRRGEGPSGGENRVDFRGIG